MSQGTCCGKRSDHWHVLYSRRDMSVVGPPPPVWSVVLCERCVLCAWIQNTISQKIVKPAWNVSTVFGPRAQTCIVCTSTCGSRNDGNLPCWECQAFACKDGKIRLLNPELNARRMQKGADALLHLGRWRVDLSEEYVRTILVFWVA